MASITSSRVMTLVTLAGSIAWCSFWRTAPALFPFSISSAAFRLHRQLHAPGPSGHSASSFSRSIAPPSHFFHRKPLPCFSSLYARAGKQQRPPPYPPQIAAHRPGQQGRQGGLGRLWQPDTAPEADPFRTARRQTARGPTGRPIPAAAAHTKPVGVAGRARSPGSAPPPRTAAGGTARQPCHQPQRRQEKHHKAADLHHGPCGIPDGSDKGGGKGRGRTRRHPGPAAADGRAAPRAMTRAASMWTAHSSPPARDCRSSPARHAQDKRRAAVVAEQQQAAGLRPGDAALPGTAGPRCGLPQDSCPQAQEKRPGSGRAAAQQPGQQHPPPARAARRPGPSAGPIPPETGTAPESPTRRTGPAHPGRPGPCRRSTAAAPPAQPNIPAAPAFPMAVTSMA